jgi:uncharacterized protein (DUF1810 family)
MPAEAINNHETHEKGIKKELEDDPRIADSLRHSAFSAIKNFDGTPPMTQTGPHDLSRFVEAQGDTYARALSEIRNGDKRTHWMWFIFPQIEGLGTSSTARFYSIKNAEEARAYLQHPVLGPRLVECAEAALGVQGRSAHEIFGFPDDLKLKSCATLFAAVSPAGSVFDRLLEKYYGGERDEKTVALLEER